GIDVLHVAQVRRVGDAVEGAREQLRGQEPLEAVGERLERRVHARGVPASGPGVCSKTAVTRRRTTTAGQVAQPRVISRGIPIVSGCRLNPCHCAVMIARSPGVACRMEGTMPLTWVARSSVGRPKLTAACPVASRSGRILDAPRSGT